MTEKIPETLGEALKAGGKLLSESEWKNFIAKLPDTFSSHIENLAVDCEYKPVHTKCHVTPCIDGKRAVVYCNAAHDCSDRVLFDC